MARVLICEHTLAQLLKGVYDDVNTGVSAWRLCKEDVRAQT